MKIGLKFHLNLIGIKKSEKKLMIENTFLKLIKRTNLQQFWIRIVNMLLHRSLGNFSTRWSDYKTQWIKSPKF